METKMAEAKKSHGKSRSAEIATASGIIILIVLMLMMVMHHPVAGQKDAADLIESIASQASAIRFVHGTVAAAMTVVTSLMLGFAIRLDISRPNVLLGAVSSSLSLVLICLAVLLDGFVAPALASQCVAIGGDCAAAAQAMLRYGGLQIEFMTRFGLVALAAATVLLAGDLILRKDGARMFGALGLASAIVQLGLLTSGDRLDPHCLALIVMAQAVWYASVGALIILRKGPYALDQLS
jgi:hypothetical protein